MYVYIMPILLSILLAIQLKFSDKDLSSPAIIFTFSFIPASLVAMMYSKRWEMGLHLNTLLVILVGCIVFYIICLCVSKAYNHFKDYRRGKANKEIKLVEIDIDKYKEAMCLIFVILANLVYLYSVVKAVGGNILNIKEIPEYIGKYNQIFKFGNDLDEVRLNIFVRNLEPLLFSIGCWFLYIIINNLFVNRRVKLIEVGILSFCVLITILTGSRGNIITFLLIGISIYLVLLKHQGKKINSKVFKVILTLMCIVLISFFLVSFLIGRNNVKDYRVTDYFAIYCGAEIKNLDIFLQNKDSISKNYIWGSQTFVTLIRNIGTKIGLENESLYRLDLPFQQVNGFNLGNVYTTFYAYIYDFGYIGAIFVVALMAIVSQLAFELAQNSKRKEMLNVRVLIYAYIFSNLALSFFSNKFYESVFNFNFIKYIILWILYNRILENKNFKKQKLSESCIN